MIGEIDEIAAKNWVYVEVLTGDGGIHFCIRKSNWCKFWDQKNKTKKANG